MKQVWQEAFATWLRGQPATSLTQRELRSILDEIKDAGVVPRKLTFDKFKTLAREAELIDELTIRRTGAAGNQRKTIARYALNRPSPMVVGLSLRERSYLSHVSALFVHGLTEQIPQTVFVNREQSRKKLPNSTLTQTSIDRVFGNRVRRSQNIWAFDKTRFILLNGKHTADFGVEMITTSSGEILRVTNLERTLIDILVRPGYAGGILEILAAFRNARARISVDRLLSTLHSLDYSYPYHQALGYVLEQTGYPESDLKKVRALGSSFTFYLDYGLRNPELNSTWRIFVPKGLKTADFG